MINNFVKYEIVEESKGSPNVKTDKKILILKYPCSNLITCTPYRIDINPGKYIFESWGAKGIKQCDVAHPGLGAYTSGTISLRKKTDFFIYIGASGQFNSYKSTTSINGYSGGGSTDLRTDYGSSWYEVNSLKSRIMVAAGGGGVEWEQSIGGNGGDLEGGESFSDSHSGGLYSKGCKGATQTKGSSCPTYGSNGQPHSGSFGGVDSFTSSYSDYGGMGGGGYYAGTSYDYSYAGSGGSSFISGHKGCLALKKTNDSTIDHTDNSFHYSGYVFYNTEMIAGNKTMPLPIGGKGIWDDFNGAFRITLIATSIRTARCLCTHRFSFVYFAITLSSG